MVRDGAGEALGLRRIVLHANAPHHFLRTDDVDAGLKVFPEPDNRGISAHPALGCGVLLRHVLCDFVGTGGRPELNASRHCHNRVVA